MASTKKKRKIELSLRQADLTNLNLKPEKHGDELEPRADLTLKFIVKDGEIAQLVSAKGNPLKLLWHTDKSVMFRDIDTFPVGFEAEGTLRIGVSDEHLVEFKDAKLKKITLTPHIELQAAVSCQVRIIPTGSLEALEEMLLTTSVVAGFSGAETENEDKQEQLEGV